ncbi:DUF4381 domain-containing protein [Alteromonas facilis]|uniref:DUF4381 domain-containing protein n=1 Tax=Alteromonas facilis TaxID=2048004 RepID=UPI000C28962C|nr:DUF4381 domain-containing protein [Alteromonas facilis]
MDPLAQLHDISLAQPVDWWPLAWGWWVVIICALAITTSLIVIVWRHRKNNRVRRAALAQIDSLDINSDFLARAGQINAILKQVVRHYFPVETSVSLHGAEWQHFMQTQLPQRYHKQFVALSEHTFTLHYKPQTAVSKDIADAYKDAARLWLKHADLSSLQGASNV